MRRWAAECLRVLKPGGHLLAFGGARTYHRLAAGVEDAGLEIRDQLVWIYAQGMPKSHNISKAIDKAAGATRPVIGKSRGSQPAKSGHHDGLRGSNIVEAGERFRPDVTGPATAAAKESEGWGTGLKPAHEPIGMARKPLAATVASNVVEFRIGAINVSGCSIPFADGAHRHESTAKNQHADFGTAPGGNHVFGDYTMVSRRNYNPEGRHPANVILTDRVFGDGPSRFSTSPRRPHWTAASATPTRPSSPSS